MQYVCLQKCGPGSALHALNLRKYISHCSLCAYKVAGLGVHCTLHTLKLLIVTELVE